MTFEDDLLALERKVLADNAGNFLAAVDELRTAMAMQAPGIPAMIARLAIPQLEAAAKAGVTAAWTAGGEWAVTSAETADVAEANALQDASHRLASGPPKHLTDPLDGLDGFLAEAKVKALGLLRGGASTDAALAPIFGAATAARSRVVTQLNAASNAASETVGDTIRSPMVWEAERNACVHCLALSGHVIQAAGDTFPLISYGEIPAAFGAISTPPRHPHCRCRLAVLASQEYADTLKREAQRSVLRGFALQSESQAVRVKAAKKLLERDPLAPKSVKAYAARAVREGAFPRGRDVPKGDPRLIITGPKKPPPAPPPPKPPAPVQVVEPAVGPHRFTDIADMKAFGERMGGPSAANKKHVTEYTSGTSGDLNSTLRGGRSKYTSQKQLDALRNGLDDEMRQSSTPEDVVVFRGAPLAAFGDKTPDLFVGKVVSDKAFLSTSMAPDMLAIGKGLKVHLELRVPKGTRAIYAAGVSKHKAERELLLDRDSGLAIESATYNERTDKWRVVATVVQKPKK